MGATDSKMRAPEGILPVLLISGLLLGTCLSEQACADDACFDQGIQELKIERSKTDSTSGLKYVERSTDLVATVDMIGVCLPGVNPNVLADSFLSCSNEKVEEVCTMVKRGWLEDREGKSVVNENAVLATFKELNGGEDAVRECLQIPEVYEYEYYYYDYAYYDDEYDYLEESASESRQRRAVGENGKKKKQTKRNKSSGKNRKKGRKGREGGKRQTRKQNKKASRKAAKKEAKKAKRKAKKEARKARKQAEKKAEQKVKKTEKKAKESSKAEKDARKKALSKLGLKKMPSKSTLEKLTCVQDKIKELVVACAKNILSKTN